MVLPYLLKKNKYMLSAFAWIGLCFSFVFLRFYLQEVLLKKYFNVCNFCNFNTYNYVALNFFQSISWILLPGVIIWLLDHRFRAEKVNIELQEQKIRSERAYLQAQLNPHFVFNSLHTIYSMVYHNAPDSLSAIKTFSDILRYSLNPLREEGINLTVELDHLKKYIELQKFRTQKIYVVLDVDGIDEHTTVPPLMLITFVENAFKHGIYNDVLHPVTITIKKTQGVLFFHCENKINRNRKANSLAIGLSSMKRILELVYGTNQKLIIDEKNNVFAVSLTIKLLK